MKRSAAQKRGQAKARPVAWGAMTSPAWRAWLAWRLRMFPQATIWDVAAEVDVTVQILEVPGLCYGTGGSRHAELWIGAHADPAVIERRLALALAQNLLQSSNVTAWTSFDVALLALELQGGSCSQICERPEAVKWSKPANDTASEVSHG